MNLSRHLYQNTMADTPPLRLNSRPQLRIALSHFNGSPRAASYSTPISSGASTPYTAPFPKAMYLPRGSGKPPTPYKEYESEEPKKRKVWAYCSYVYWRAVRLLRFRTIWVMIFCIVCLSWWFRGNDNNWDHLRQKAEDLRRGLLPEARLRGMQFFPASNPKIHASTARSPRTSKC